MEHFVVSAAVGTYTSAIIWGGLAVVAAVFALILVSETSSAVHHPGCQRGVRADKAAR